MRNTEKFVPENHMLSLEVSWEDGGEIRTVSFTKGNQRDCAFIFYRDGEETQRLWLTDEAFEAMVSLKDATKNTLCGVE